MRILITGINGFVAGHLAEYLLAHGGYELWGQSRGVSLALPQLRGRVQLYSADLQDAAAVRALLEAARPDVVMHLAAQAAVGLSFSDPLGTLLPNISGQVQLFEALLHAKLDPLVLIVGSADVYGLIDPATPRIDETTPLRPSNPYAVSKIAQDMLALQYWLSRRVRAVRLRPFNHIGPRQSEHFVASAFAAQIARIEAGEQPPVLRVGNLEAERDFTDVRDMVRAYHLAFAHCEPGEVYNIGSSRATRINHLLALLLAHSRVPITVEPDPARMRPSDVPRMVCDRTKFEAATGWQPHIPLEQTLADLLDYWRGRVAS
jgi:GDP-4-dehydro-6-deoxy-D-mannose reductase